MLSVTELSNQFIKLSDYHYIKVMHNDPVNDPSLSQLNRNDRWELWVNACCRGLLNLNNQRTLIEVQKFFS
ncbi:MAG: CDP-glycerol:glycerophosphate glycerophosphotransferase [Acetilactobacillus jinshanensis]